MKTNNEKAGDKIRALEATLFIYGEPVDLKKIQELLKVTSNEAEELVKGLREALTGRGLCLVEHDGALQIVTHPDFAKMLESIVKDEFARELTPASLESLGIVAYAGPISRSRIDYIRGVNSSYILRNLLIRGLIDRKLDPKRSSAYLYSVSFDLLRHLGLGGINELPQFEEYHNLVKNAEQKLEASLSPKEITTEGIIQVTDDTNTTT